MERELPRSVADEFEEMQERARRRHRPHPPRGELTEEELGDFLSGVRAEMLRARLRAGLTQAQVAAMMDTTKSAVSRLERLGPNSPSLTTMCRYANAIECRFEVRFAPKCPPADRPFWWPDEDPEPWL